MLIHLRCCSICLQGTLWCLSAGQRTDGSSTYTSGARQPEQLLPRRLLLLQEEQQWLRLRLHLRLRLLMSHSRAVSCWRRCQSSPPLPPCCLASSRQLPRRPLQLQRSRAALTMQAVPRPSLPLHPQLIAATLQPRPQQPLQPPQQPRLQCQAAAMQLRNTAQSQSSLQRHQAGPLAQLACQMATQATVRRLCQLSL